MTCREREPAGDNPTLDQRRMAAIAGLTTYLHSPEESILMEHQLSMFESLKNHFEQGESYGHRLKPEKNGRLRYK